MQHYTKKQKAQIIPTNEIVEKEFNNLKAKYLNGDNTLRSDIFKNIKPKKLRHMQACVYETDDYYIMKSYETIVACINKINRMLYDFQELTYPYHAPSWYDGYWYSEVYRHGSATTGKQIRAFYNDYPAYEMIHYKNLEE